MDILFERLSDPSGDLGVIKLNRLDSLNALTHDMITAMFEQLLEWRQDASIKAVIIKSLHEKAFCAGGDVRALYDKKQANDETICQFFYDEYRLNFLIHQFRKPFIALINGITMGGGVGVSIHGSHRIAIEEVMFAMPETGIGLFPDIGGGYLLSRCPEPYGLYLALTGDKINAADALYLELIDRVIAQDEVEPLISDLLAAEMKHEANTVVSHIKRSFCKEPQPGKLQEKRALIEKCFEADSVEAILEALQREDSEQAQRLHQQLLSKSPMSLKITFEQLKRSQGQSLASCLQMEYRMVNRFMQGHDFFEGVRALLVDKDKSPSWQPGSLAEVTDAMVESYFQPVGKELNLEDLF